MTEKPTLIYCFVSHFFLLRPFLDEVLALL